MKKIRDCATLREYREDVLGLPQTEIGRRCKRHQAWISAVERGHLPRMWNREGLLKAYELRQSDFVRLVTGALHADAIQKPIAEDMPLFATATAVKPAEVSKLVDRLTVGAERKRAHA